MSTNTVTVMIHLRDGAPRPQVTDLGGRRALIEFLQGPDSVALALSSVEQARSLRAAVDVAEELIAGGDAS